MKEYKISDSITVRVNEENENLKKVIEQHKKFWTSGTAMGFDSIKMIVTHFLLKSKLNEFTATDLGINIEDLNIEDLNIEDSEQKDRNSYIPVKTKKLRKPYYELADKIFEMREVAKEMDDPKLISLGNELTDTINKITRHINTKYIWD